MPVHKVTLQDGTEGWRYGATGKIYTGPDARKKAEAQAAAIHASGWKEHKTAAAEYDDETVARARRFVAETLARARKRKLSAFVVTDGASGIANNDNPAVKAARDAHIQWELEHGSDPYEDWSKTASYAEFCKMAGINPFKPQSNCVQMPDCAIKPKFNIPTYKDILNNCRNSKPEEKRNAYGLTDQQMRALHDPKAVEVNIKFIGKENANG